MAEKIHSKMNYGQYDCSLEELTSRNASIIRLFVLGIASAVLMFGILQVQWFFEEGIHALQTVGMQVDPVCVSAGGTEETCMYSVGGGGVWWLLLGTFLASIGIAPLAAMALKITYRTKGVTQEWQDTTNGLLLFGLPFSAIWALLWLVCLPVAWTLLPWGDWATNWWKIFPYGFGLIWFGGLPLLLVLRNFVKMVFSPEYAYDKKSAELESEVGREEKEVESERKEEQSSDPRATHREQSANVADAGSNKRPAVIALVIGIFLFIIGLPLFIGSGQENLGMLIPGAIAFGVGGFMAVVASFALISSWATSYSETGKPAPWWTKVAPVFAVFLLIPGVVLLILGGIAAENFEHYGVSTATLEIEDVDMLGDQGFIIFVKGTPGDNNGNGIHDYCENIIVNATHSGDWMSTPWNAESTPNAADETRQVFELEISHEGSGCDAQHWPKEKWKNDTQLVKIGRACYGCMAGNTTITAEYVSSEGINPPAPMWIQNGEVLVGSTVMTIFGAILAGIGTLTIIGSIGIILKLKEVTRRSLEEEKEHIEIIESIPGQPVRFRINHPPKGRDAWVGIYPASTGDLDHGDRWSWLRDIDASNATLPGQPAGKWSIRVFKDGGYKLQNRVDFEIHSPHQQPSASTSSEGTVAGNTTITTSKSTYTIDEGINFSFTASKLPDDAWIGIVPVAIPHGDEAVNDRHDTSYQYLAGRTNGSITLPNPGLGTWTLRLHDTDNNGRELTHVVFEVVSSLGSSGHEKFEFVPVSEYDEVWNDSGSGAEQDVSVWRPRVPAGCHLIGMTAKNGHSRPTFSTLVIRAGGRDIAPPERFDLVWWQERGKRRFWCWRPIPPAGYVSLGDVGTTSETPPSHNDVVCVALACLSPNRQPLGGQIWNDRGGGAPKDAAFFTQPGGTGLFRCSDDATHNKPHGEFPIPAGASTSPHTTQVTNGIEILEAVVGKPVRFKINNGPSGNDAWFGLYPEQATDQEHGEHHQNWMYFREVGQNEISLPAKSAGRWSIRVFSDGGYNQIGRLDFEITGNRSSDSAKRIQSALKGSIESGSTNFWDTVK